MATYLQVADFFLANADADDEITALKLQKLCAYAQAFSLTLLEHPLFPEDLRAYTHGPVIRELYEAYRGEGRNPLSTMSSKKDTRLPFSSDELFILETVNGYYGAYSASRLRNMSHADFPGEFGSQAVIPASEIVARFADNKVVRAIRESC